MTTTQEHVDCSRCDERFFESENIERWVSTDHQGRAVCVGCEPRVQRPRCAHCGSVKGRLHSTRCTVTKMHGYLHDVDTVDCNTGGLAG